MTYVYNDVRQLHLRGHGGGYIDGKLVFSGTFVRDIQDPCLHRCYGRETSDN